MNVVQIKRHVLHNLSWRLGNDPRNITILQHVKSVSERWKTSSITTDPNILFDFKVNHVDVKLTLGIINFNISIGNFIVVENIFGKVNSYIN